MEKYVIFLFLGVYLLTACFDDKGNYDYTDINELTISGIQDSEYSAIAFVDTFRLTPNIEYSLPSKEEDFEYSWKLMPMSMDVKDVEEGEDFIVGREKNLNLIVNQKAGKYVGFFLAKDKKTGVTWRKKFSMQVRTLTSEGWLILCDEAGKARMDLMIDVNENEHLVARNIWSNDDFETGKPLDLMFTYHHYDAGTHTLLVTEKGTFDLDVHDLHVGEDNNFKWRFGVTPEKVNIKDSEISFYSDKEYWAVIDEQGDLYTSSFADYGSVFEFPVNSLDGQPIKLAPFIGVHYVWVWQVVVAPFLLYDETNAQFLAFRSGAVYPSFPIFSGETLFDAKTGKEFVHGESMKTGYTRVVLKDPNEARYYFYGFQFLNGEKFEQTHYGEIQGPELEEVKYFAFHHQFPYLFYATGNKVYQVDMTSPQTPAKEILNFPNEEIKVLKFNSFVAWEAYQDWERAREFQLVVGTTVNGKEDSECGVMRMYNVPNLMEPLVLKKEIKDLGNIIRIVYKERAK